MSVNLSLNARKAHHTTHKNTQNNDTPNRTITTKSDI